MPFDPSTATPDDVPPPPRKFDPTTAKPVAGKFDPSTAKPVGPTPPPSIADRLFSAAKYVVTAPEKTAEHFSEDYAKEREQGVAEVKAGAAQATSGGIKNAAVGAGKAALGSLDYLFSVPQAAIHQVAGRPAEGVAKMAGASPETAQKVGGYADVVGSLFSGPPAEAIGKTIGAAAKEATKAAKPVMDTIEKIFSPTTVSTTARRAEAVRREETGLAARATAQSGAALDQYAAQINKLPVEDQRAFVSYVENASKGAELKDPTLKPVADQMREIYENRRAQIEALDPESKATFVTDYYPHMWKEKNPTLANPEVGGGLPPKQGSGRNLKKRTIPTIEDGLAAGLTPVTDNPLEATMMYVSNMDRFLAENKIVQRARDVGDIKYFSPGKQPQGWVELQGRLANKTAAFADKEGDARAMPMRAYAPEDFARIYNNSISQGMRGTALGRTVYDSVQKTVNATTMMQLGLSGFHGYTMAQEAMVDGLQRAIGKGLTGDIKGAAKGGAKSLFPQPASIEPFSLYKRGKQVENVYSGVADHGPDFEKIVNLGTRANMRMAGGRADWMRASARKSYFDAWKKGSLKTELLADVKGAQASPIMGTAKGVATNVARVMDTVAAPLFDKMIPRLKNGAFYENMGDWLKAHPAASQEEQLKAARDIADSIDNRFGELNMDNIFWNKAMKQTLQLLIRAPGWDIGTLRELGGGVADLAKGGSMRELSPRTKYIIALPVVAMLGNEAWSYLKTGKPSTDPFTYPTGGVNPDGTPEKAMVPGYMRDVFGYLHDIPGSIVDEAKNKVATVPGLVADLLSNRDYRDLPISQLSQWAIQRGVPGPFMSYLNHVFQSYVPISLKTYQGRKTGSGISTPEAALGIRPAPMYMSESDKYKSMIERRRRMLDQERQRSDRKQQSQLESNQPQENK